MEKTYKITKLVVCIILLCTTFATALYFAIIPFVKVDTNFNFTTPDYIEVRIGNNYKHYNSDSETFAELLNLYNNSFKTTKKEVVFGQEVINKTEFLTTNTNINYSNGTYLVLGYDGENETKTIGKTNLEYNRIIVLINNNENMVKSTAYIMDIEKPLHASFKFVSYMKGSNLYEYMNDLF